MRSVSKNRRVGGDGGGGGICLLQWPDPKRINTIRVRDRLRQLMMPWPDIAKNDIWDDVFVSLWCPPWSGMRQNEPWGIDFCSLQRPKK